ncbi:hypothetical protein WJX73_002696 [Symbiochloris irregularis]|uniref:Uncharacterized protein n=1 Tax=Symbiochloris irregularis TaxID=706552 RepID=A0AAW1NWF6_9CHLO
MLIRSSAAAPESGLLQSKHTCSHVPRTCWRLTPVQHRRLTVRARASGQKASSGQHKHARTLAAALAALALSSGSLWIAEPASANDRAAEMQRRRELLNKAREKALEGGGKVSGEESAPAPEFGESRSQFSASEEKPAATKEPEADEQKLSATKDSALKPRSEPAPPLKSQAAPQPKAQPSPPPAFKSEPKPEPKPQATPPSAFKSEAKPEPKPEPKKPAASPFNLFGGGEKSQAETLKDSVLKSAKDYEKDSSKQNFKIRPENPENPDVMKFLDQFPFSSAPKPEASSAEQDLKPKTSPLSRKAMC